MKFCGSKSIISVCWVCCFLCSFWGCSQKGQNSDYARLLKIDTILSSNPEKALDSLKNINYRNFSKYNYAYYQLLTVIASDKSYVTFTSDSLIKGIIPILAANRVKHPRKYARGLLYLGLVRYRIGEIDNTVYQPIKDAVIVLENTKPIDIKNLYLCYYYLGELNYQNNNLKLSFFYYSKALDLAKSLKNDDYLFSIYFSLYWNQMRIFNYQNAKLYLDSLSKWKTSDIYRSDVNVAFATYYKNQKQFDKALAVEYELLSDKNMREDSSLLSRVYYRISEDYSELNKPDSALKYAALTKSLNNDTTNYLNYYYYNTIAVLALKTKDWKTSAEASLKAYELLNTSISKQLDTKVFELEKKYDLSEAHNKKLVAERRSYFYLALSSALLTMIIYFFFLARQRLLKERMAKTNVEHELIMQNHQLEQVKKDAITKRWVNDLYQYVIDRDKKLQDLLYKLESNKLFRQNEKMMTLLNETLNEYSKEMKEGSIKLLDEDMFTEFTGLSTDDAKLLLDSEKLLLVLMVFGMNNKQIASLIGSSPESIRKRKVFLLKKLEDNNISVEKFTNIDTNQ